MMDTVRGSFRFDGRPGSPSATTLHTGMPWSLIRRIDHTDPQRSRMSGPPVAGRTAIIVKNMARSGAAITDAAHVLREAGAAVTHVAVAISWNPAWSDVLAPVGLTPVCALGLADFQALRSPAPDQMAESAQPDASQ